MAANDEPLIIYEPEPTVSLLTGNEAAAVCWLLRRYSSHSYISRNHALWRSIVDDFDAWPPSADRCSADTLQDWA